ncbi:MAG: SDR family NAD(P)-dependent oxidoreductase [Flavobacteriaceae bacterium]
MGKTILVTGASRGIGFEVAKQALAAGHQVWAISRSTEALKTLEGVHVQSVDLSIPESIHDFVSSLPSAIRFDAVIHNAAAFLNKPFAQTTWQDFELLYKTNVFAIAELTRLLLPKMNAAAHFLSISSVGGILGSVKFPGLAAYSSSKGALGILTELLAEEFKDSGLSFNALALGAVQTEMLAEAFPGYQAPLNATEMGAYVLDFSFHGHRYFNGKVLPVSVSTP